MVEIPQVPADLGSPLERYMRAMMTEIMASMARALRDDKLSLPELAALQLLDTRGPMRIGDLGQELLLDLPAASRLASGLVERGLVLRQEDKADRRAKTVSLSDEGRALIERIIQKRIAETTKVMVGVEGAMSERFLEFYAQIGADGLDRSK